MDNLMNLYRNERVNDYFKKYAHTQIDIAHRILEYLEPDIYFPPKELNQNTVECFLRNDIDKAISNIFEEIDVDNVCPGGYEALRREAITFTREILKDYLIRKKNEKLTEREKLLIRLGELEEELKETE